MEGLGNLGLSGDVFLADHRVNSEGMAVLQVGDDSQRLAGPGLEGEVDEVDVGGHLDDLAPVAARRLSVGPPDQIGGLEAELQASVLGNDGEGLAHQGVGARQPVGGRAFFEVVVGLPGSGGGHWTASRSMLGPGQPV